MNCRVYHIQYMFPVLNGGDISSFLCGKCAQCTSVLFVFFYAYTNNSPDPMFKQVLTFGLVFHVKSFSQSHLIDNF